MVVVVPVGAAGVKREDGVELQPHALDQTHEFDVRRPIVLAGSVALHDAPPDVHHDALDARALKRAETVRQLLHALKLALARDGIQREHDVHGDAPSRARRGGGGRLVTAGFPARPDYSGRIVPERHYYTAPIGGGEPPNGLYISPGGFGTCARAPIPSPSETSDEATRVSLHHGFASSRLRQCAPLPAVTPKTRRAQHTKKFPPVVDFFLTGLRGRRFRNRFSVTTPETKAGK